MKRLKLLFQHRHNQTKHMTYMIETIKYWYFLLQTSKRDSERNSEWIFMKRWQCPIYYGTIETLFWLEKCLFLWVSSLLLINKKYTIHFRRELENDQKNNDILFNLIRQSFQEYYCIIIISYMYSTTKHEILQISNHNLLCSLDPPNQGWLFWVVGPKIINDTEYNWLHITRYVFG